MRDKCEIDNCDIKRNFLSPYCNDHTNEVNGYVSSKNYDQTSIQSQPNSQENIDSSNELKTEEIIFKLSSKNLKLKKELEEANAEIKRLKYAAKMNVGLNKKYNKELEEFSKLLDTANEEIKRLKNER